MERIAASLALGLAACVPAWTASNPEALFARSPILGHLPASTVAMVLVDLDAIRASDAAADRSWTSVALAQISERFRFEEHRLDLDRDVSAFAFVEIWDREAYHDGYLVELRKGARAPARAADVRDFEDGTFAIGEPPLIDRLLARGAPDHLSGLLSRLDLTAPVIGVTRHPLRLTVSRGNLNPPVIPLPGIAFALQVGMGEKVQISGKVIMPGPATEAEGRLFLATLADFLRPEGSFAPEGKLLAADARIAASGDTISLRLTLPREALVVAPSPAARCAWPRRAADR